VLRTLPYQTCVQYAHFCDSEENHVALIDAAWQRRQQLHADGVQYDFSTRDCGDGLFQAAWVCASCHQEGALAPVSTTLKGALLLSRIGAHVHHRLIHRGESKSMDRSAYSELTS
jgi:hypothetical protein